KPNVFLRDTNDTGAVVQYPNAYRGINEFGGYKDLSFFLLRQFQGCNAVIEKVRNDRFNSRFTAPQIWFSFSKLHFHSDNAIVCERLKCLDYVRDYLVYFDPRQAALVVRQQLYGCVTRNS